MIISSKYSIEGIEVINKRNKFINNHFMNSKSYKKDKKSSKSA